MMSRLRVERLICWIPAFAGMTLCLMNNLGLCVNEFDDLTEA